MTSSSASAGGACTGTGVAPTRIQGVLGVSKAYITRVGGGPFPTEAFDGAGDRIRERGKEFGAVTGRPRRCGWFDVPLLRYTANINGFDSLVITKLDVLDEFDQIPVCVGYKIGGREVVRDAADRRRDREGRGRLRVRARLEQFDVRNFELRGTAGEGQGIPGVPGEPAREWKWAAFPPGRSGIRRSCAPARGSKS